GWEQVARARSRCGWCRRALPTRPGQGCLKEPSSLIAVERLTKSYGSSRAVDDVTFRVAPGKVTGFLGPNGAGKSTTMRLILGLDRPDAGRAVINGKPLAEHARPLSEVGSLLEARAVHTGRSARNHLRTL